MIKGTHDVSVFSKIPRNVLKIITEGSPLVLTNRLLLPQWAQGLSPGYRGWGQGGMANVQGRQGSTPLEISPKGLVEI